MPLFCVAWNNQTKRATCSQQDPSTCWEDPREQAYSQRNESDREKPNFRCQESRLKSKARKPLQSRRGCRSQREIRQKGNRLVHTKQVRCHSHRRKGQHQTKTKNKLPSFQKEEKNPEWSDQTQTARQTRSRPQSHPARSYEDAHSGLLQAMTTEIVTATKDNAVNGELFCLQAMFPDKESDPDAVIQAQKAMADPDTMYLHEAMCKPDKDKFKVAIQKVMDDQWDNDNYDLVKCSEIPEDTSVLPAVWQMCCKRDIMTHKIKK